VGGDPPRVIPKSGDRFSDKITRKTGIVIPCRGAGKKIAKQPHAKYINRLFAMIA